MGLDCFPEHYTKMNLEKNLIDCFVCVYVCFREKELLFELLLVKLLHSKHLDLIQGNTIMQILIEYFLCGFFSSSILYKKYPITFSLYN